MPVKIKSFLGKPGFAARVLFPNLTSAAYMRAQQLARRRKATEYIQKCLQARDAQQTIVPLKINIETINRCNGKCPFCPASAGSESRPYKLMSDALLERLFREMEQMRFCGALSYHLNNEPFLDKRMVDILREARARVPGAYISIFTNGSVLTAEGLEQISGAVDKLTINNYNDKHELLPHIGELYDHVRSHGGRFEGMSVVIAMRYSGEVLTNRAGTAPNKPHKDKLVHYPCIMPFTDFTVFPDGVAGLCCSDALERTNFGDVNEQSVMEIFNSDAIWALRRAVGADRSRYEFCKHCDFIDAGQRMDYIAGGQPR